MEEKQMDKLAVGQPLPGPIRGEGPSLEIGHDGSPTLFMGMPGMSRPERKALGSGFNRYALNSQGIGGITLLTWVFRFPKPIGFADLPFHAGLYGDERGAQLTGWQGNALMFIGLDGQTITHLKTTGLKPEAVDLFRRVAARQIEERPTQDNYEQAVARLREKAPEALFKTGTQFWHGPKSQG